LQQHLGRDTLHAGHLDAGRLASITHRDGRYLSNDGDNAMKRLTWSIATAIALAVPSIASAANGFVTGNVRLRAGPAWDYPMIANVRAGSPISILGCTAGWTWCDVVVFRDRGWLPGNRIQSTYQGQRAPILVYGARIGVPIVSFEIGNYWDTYYRGRPFYRDRGRWYRRLPPPRVMPLPHPIPNPVPAHHPIDYPPSYHHNPVPPPRVVPMPHPTPNPTPPPRVMPMPHSMPNPHVMPQKPAPASSSKDDQASQ
jgi:uncharacterized protein YraI